MQPISSSSNPTLQAGSTKFQLTPDLLLPALLIGLNLVILIFVQSHNSAFEKGDFKMFYTAAFALRTGHASDLYSRDLHVTLQREIIPSLPLQDVKVYTHPPYELLAYLPLSFLPYQTACYCWLGLTVVIAVVCGRLLSRYWMVLGLFPFLVTVLEQQDSALALLILVACWLALRNNDNGLAGFWLGVALFKFPTVIPLTLMLLMWRPILLKGVALSASLAILISLAMVGPGGMRSYLEYVSNMARGSTTAVSKQYQIDPRTSPTLRGLSYEIASGGGEAVDPRITRILPPLLVFLDLLGLGIAWKFMRSDALPHWKFAFALLLALLLSFHLLMHDLVLLALPSSLLQGNRARWPLAPFYLALLIYFFYPHSQAWLALLLVVTVILMMYQTLNIRFGWPLNAAQ